MKWLQMIFFGVLLKWNKCITYLTGGHMLIHLCCDYSPKQKSQFMLQRQNFPFCSIFLKLNYARDSHQIVF